MLTTIALMFLASFPVLQEELPLAAERHELAEIRVLLGADRDYAAGEERLAALAKALEGSTDPEAVALAAEVTRLSTEVRRALGEAAPASFAGASQDKLDAAVGAAIERGDFAFVYQLGSRAGPALAAAIEAAPDVFSGNPGGDPLLWLLRVDPPGADALLGRMLPYDAFLWRKRVVRALETNEPWANATTLWSTDVPQRWKGPGILRTLEELTRDPEVGGQALMMLGQLVKRGARSDVFLPRAAEAVRSAERARREPAKSALRPQPIDATRVLLEELLREPDVDLRIFAASLLSQVPGDALLGLADDPDRVVRLWVAERLEEGREDGLDTAEVRALARLVADEDPEVRRRALGVVASLPKERRGIPVSAEESTSGNAWQQTIQVFADPLPDELYRTAVAHADPEGTRRLVEVAAALPAPLCFELFEALAADSDPQVLENVVKGLDALPVAADPEAWLRVVSRLLANPAAGEARERAVHLLRGVGATRSGLVALARWLLAHPEVDLADVHMNWPALARADSALFADYAAHRFERSPAELGDRLQLVDPDPVLRLARDPARSLPLRLVALRRAASRLSHSPEVNAEAGAAAEALLAEPGWGALEPEAWGFLDRELSELVQRLPGVHRNPVLAAMIANERFPEWLMPFALALFEPELPGAVEIGRLVLDRWFAAEGQPERIGAVRQALWAMRQRPELRDDQLLAAATRRDELAATAWSVIGALRDPALLPLIRAEVEASANPRAVEALFSYMSDEAAEGLLLAAARTTDAELRDQALAHLEKIREYQESRERWATRKVKAATREQVVAELLEQLESPSDDVKVQAIRALATWEAVEAMPRLIGLTQSGSKAVAAAAREALDRLNAPKEQ